MKESKWLGTLAAFSALAFAGSALAAPTLLRASHQFPGGKGDVRDEMVQMIARDAKAAGVDLDVQVYPGASLFKPNEQWNALVNGQLDISSFPLDYASGKVRAFGATLMPGLVRSHERAARINHSPFMKDIKAKIDKAGVVVLADAWLAGAIASKKACIRTPSRKYTRIGGRFDRLDPLERGLQCSADRRRRRHRHQLGQLRLVPHLRTGEVPDGAR